MLPLLLLLSRRIGWEILVFIPIPRGIAVCRVRGGAERRFVIGGRKEEFKGSMNRSALAFRFFSGCWVSCLSPWKILRGLVGFILGQSIAYLASSSLSALLDTPIVIRARRRSQGLAFWPFFDDLKNKKIPLTKKAKNSFPINLASISFPP